MMPRMELCAIALAAGVLTAGGARAATINVGPGESIQAAIDGAGAGDTVAIAAGVYSEDLDVRGKAITVVGTGADTIIRGSGNGPVVTIASGEGSATILDSVQVTGGSAARGGGLFVENSSPTIVRTVIFDNRASLQGSGVFLRASSATLRNNLVVYNRSNGGDPHSIEIVDAAPQLINNTVVRGDSNGIIMRGNSPALVMNNVIALNGRKVDGSRRGRGICDFSLNNVARIHYNVFYRNNVAALLTDGTDFRRLRTAQRRIGAPRLIGNLDGAPRLIRRLRSLDPSVTIDVRDFALDPGFPGRAVDGGNPDPAFNDLDGTRNDVGFTGGPEAAVLP